MNVTTRFKNPVDFNAIMHILTSFLRATQDIKSVFASPTRLHG